MDPGSPPPPYTGNRPHAVAVPYVPPHLFNQPHATRPIASSSRPPYGPTRLGIPSESTGLVLSYNPFLAREVIAEAKRRAWWRFFEALLWALGICYILGWLADMTLAESGACAVDGVSGAGRSVKVRLNAESR